MGGIFVSYRRVDSRADAGRLFDRLKRHFGHRQVFMDVEGGISRGDDFSRKIDSALQEAKALVVVVGREWLTCKDSQGHTRLSHPDDWVRVEIKTALTRDILVLPVLVNGAAPPRADQLPEDIQALAGRQAADITDGKWDYDVSQIIRTLEGVQGRPGHRKAFATVGVLALLASLAAASYWIYQGARSTEQPTSAVGEPGPAASDTPDPEQTREPPPSPTAGSGAKVGTARTTGSQAPTGPVPAPSPTVPPPLTTEFGPAPGPVDCRAFMPENPANVTLRQGDLVVAGGGAVYRIDRDMKETRITRGDHVIDTRGVAVAPNGQIYLSSRACGRGAIIQVDPTTGLQTPRFFGFGTPMGIYTDGRWLLVGDENPNGGRGWGQLWQINLETNERTSIFTFTRDAVATGIAREPTTNDLFFAVRRTIYRLDGKDGGVLRPLDFEGLMNIHALAITKGGEMYVGEYQGTGIMQLRRGTDDPIRTFPGFTTLTSLAASADGKSLFAAFGGGNQAKVYRVPLGEGEKPSEVWNSRGDGYAAFVTVVGQ